MSRYYSEAEPHRSQTVVEHRVTYNGPVSNARNMLRDGAITYVGTLGEDIVATWDGGGANLMLDLLVRHYPEAEPHLTHETRTVTTTEWAPAS